MPSRFAMATKIDGFPPWLDDVITSVERSGFWFITVLLLLVLLPMAMTMALLWKTKEVILDGVFGSK